MSIVFHFLIVQWTRSYTMTNSTIIAVEIQRCSLVNILTGTNVKFKVIRTSRAILRILRIPIVNRNWKRQDQNNKCCNRHEITKRICVYCSFVLWRKCGQDACFMENLTIRYCQSDHHHLFKHFGVAAAPFIAGTLQILRAEWWSRRRQAIRAFNTEMMESKYMISHSLIKIAHLSGMSIPKTIESGCSGALIRRSSGANLLAIWKTS